MKQRLKAYSIAAGALAASTSAAAAVQYTDIDPDYVGVIPDTISLDIDGDGNPDFQILGASNSVSTSSYLFLQEQFFIFPFGNNGITGSATASSIYPYALDQNDMISGGQSFNTGTGTQTLAWFSFSTYSSFSGFYGNWNNQTDKYLGVSLEINGATHYGWIRMDIGTDQIVIKDYAYEDIACLPIAAGSQVSEAPTPAAVATAVSATDVGDAANGADMEVSFTVGDETTVDAYRILVVKAAAAGAFDLATAQAVSAANYTDVTPSGGDVTTTLSATATDTDGDAIVQDEAYQVFVLSTENCTESQVDALSAPSEEVTLTGAAGLSDLEKTGVKAWTNGKQLNIETSNAALVGQPFQVINTNGQVVFESRVQNQRTSMNLDVQTGIYFIQMNVSGQSKTQKLLLM